MAFQAPGEIPGVAPEADRALGKLFTQLENELAKLDAGQSLTPVTTGSYSAKIGDLVRAVPPATGMKVLLPAANTANQGGVVLVAVISTASGGTVTVAPALTGQLVSGLATQVLNAPGLVLFESLGDNGWGMTGGPPAAGSIPLTALAAQAANTIVANATAAAASPTAFPVGANTVLGRVGGNIVAAQLVGAQVAAATLTNGLLATMPANTIKANATAGVASPTDVACGAESVFGQTSGNLQGIASAVQTALIRAAGSVFWAAAAANQVLRRSGAGDLGMGLLVDGNLTANTISAASQAQMAANTVKSNATAALANESDLAVGTNTVLGRVGANIVAAQLVAAQVTANTLTAATQTQMAADTIKGNPTAGLANESDIAVAAQSVIGRAAADIVNLTATASQALTRGAAGNLGFQALELATLAAQAAKSVVANATNGSAAPTALASSAVRQYLRVNDANTALEWARSVDGVKTAATVVSALTTVLACTGTYTPPANSLAVGSRFLVEFSYQFVRGATATVFNLGNFLNIGGSAISVAANANVAAGTYQMRVLADLTVLTTGAGGTCMANLRVDGAGTSLGADVAARYVTNLALACNTTLALAISGTAQMSLGVAGCTITATGGHVEWLA